MRNTPEQALLLRWLILSGLIAFALVIAWYEDIIQLLFAVDKSKISWAIASIYLLVTLHCARRIWIVSQQHTLSQKIDRMVRNAQEFSLSVDTDAVRLNQKTTLPDCIMTRYLSDIYYRHSSRKNNNDENTDNAADLIEIYESQIKGPQEIGWFMSDIMLKLGLLGTIIGFIFMLGSVADIADFDVSTMQQVLRHMSTGMGTALYTTLSGLICSMLTAMQYHMIDRQADELLEMIKHLTHTYVIPKMIQTRG